MYVDVVPRQSDPLDDVREPQSLVSGRRIDRAVAGFAKSRLCRRTNAIIVADVDYCFFHTVASHTIWEPEKHSSYAINVCSSYLLFVVNDIVDLYGIEAKQLKHIVYVAS